MMRFLLALVMLSIYVLGAQAQGESPKELLERMLTSEFTAQKLFKQAKDFDGFDYRPVLEGAIRGDKQDLERLFEYSGRAILLGAGAEEHAFALNRLLFLWDDDAFSATLSKQTVVVRERVMYYLDYSYVPDFKKKFPKTYSLASHEAL